MTEKIIEKITPNLVTTVALALTSIATLGVKGFLDNKGIEISNEQIKESITYGPTFLYGVYGVARVAIGSHFYDDSHSELGIRDFKKVGERILEKPEFAVRKLCFGLALGGTIGTAAGAMFSTAGYYAGQLTGWIT